MEENSSRCIEMIRQIVVHDVMMESIATGMHGAVDEHNITNLQTPDLLFGNRRMQDNLFAGQRHSFTLGHPFDLVSLPVLPALN